MLACQAIKYPMPGEESNFPRERKKRRLFRAYHSTLRDSSASKTKERNTRIRFPRAIIFFFLSFAREIEKNVTKNFLQNEIYRYLLITLRSNFVIHSYLLLIRNLLHVLPDDS